jgi:HSP20 family molecular chaperone IbpA
MTTEVNVPEENALEQNQPQLESVRLRPAADVYRDEDAVRILLDVPGATDDQIDVVVHDGELTVKAEVLRDETELRIYERSFRIDRRMDSGQVEAQLKHGVLSLRIPFHEEARPKRIPVRTGA